MSSAAIFALFGKKPVLATENAAAYDGLRDAILAEVRPRDLFEHFNTRRYVDLSWEAMRYQRSTATILEITCKAAVAALVSEFAAGGLQGHTPEQLIEGWFTNLDIRELVLDGLRPYGLDEDSVYAQAMAMRSGELARISEMRTRAEVQAVAHMREIERHRDIARGSPARLNAPVDPSKAEGRSAA
jgi:hypothetical protein